MNLLEKFNKIPKRYKTEIINLINNEENILLSPSEEKLIFNHSAESMERFEYNSLSELLEHGNFTKDEWVLIDSNFKLDCENVLHTDAQFYRTKNHLFNSENIDFFPFGDEQISELKSHKRNKLFLSYNGYPNQSRIMLLHELDKRNLLQYGLVSLLRKPTDVDFENLRDKIDSTDIWGKGGEYFESAPHLLDVYEDLSDGHSFKSLNKNYYSNNVVHHSLDFPYEHILDTFFTVVPETKYFTIEDSANLIFTTEKTYKAVATQPFIILGRPGILSHLHDIGFKTFPNMFDESYDEIEDNVERFNHIINQVEEMCNKGYDYVRELYLESFNNVLYNQQIFIDRKNDSYEDKFNNLIKDI
tara:strand:+ start:846 stop:1922 length:1077 start_codon:yes stop_codon:yes gene_type:complete